MEKIIQLLAKYGFQPFGETESNTFRIITSKSYPLPGAEITLGGRLRFTLPDTDKRCTVGKRIVSFYDVVDKKAQNFENFKTKETEKITEYLGKLK